MNLAKKASLLVLALWLTALTVSAEPASATMTPSGAKATLTVDNPAAATFSVTQPFFGSISISCTTFSLSGTVDNGAAGTGTSRVTAPGVSISGCTCTILGSSTAGSPSIDAGSWQSTALSSLGSGSYKGGMFVTRVTVACGPCNITIFFQTADGLIWTNATTSLVFNGSFKNVETSAPCFGIKFSGLTMAVTATFTSSSTADINIS